MNQDLRDKEIWVFGGAGYLGSAVTRALDACEAKVVCLDLGDNAAKLVASEGLKCTEPRACNLLELDRIPELVSGLIVDRGVPDGVVNLVTNSSRGKPFADVTHEDFRTAADGILGSGFLLSRAVAEAMKEKGKSGSIVLYSSMYGVVSPDHSLYAPPHVPNPVDYGAGKAGLLQLSRYLAVYYAREQIRFNCITPGPFPKPTYSESSPETAEALLRKVPMGRFGIPENIAGPTLFLLSDAASYVTGHNLVVDGGWTAW